MKKILSITAALFFALLFVTDSALPSIEYDGLLTKPLTQDQARRLPVPEDNMNYFFLQSIDNDTVIIIGDFTGVNKMIVYILDKGGDNTIDMVVDYYPVYNRAQTGKKSASRFFNEDIAKLKKDIISGAVFRNNYTDYMYSLPELDDIVQRWDETSITSDVYGYTAQFREIDERSKVAGYFAYGKKAAGYYLLFKTVYYRTQMIREEHPILTYSVYCKSTNDVVVKETVENLFKVKPPLSSGAGADKDTK